MVLLPGESNGALVDSDILRGDIRKVMQQEFSGFNSLDAFKNPRYFLPVNNVGRDRMQSFKYKFSSILGLAGGKEARHVLHEQPFTTTIKSSSSAKNTQVNGINYLAILSQKENKTETDRPLIILANCDTD